MDLGARAKLSKSPNMLCTVYTSRSASETQRDRARDRPMLFLLLLSSTRYSTS